VRHSRKPWKGRARDASVRDEFERALRGVDESANARRRGFDAASDRKTLQLCRQVYRALTVEMPEIAVEAVEPLGGAGQLVVRVIVPSGASPMEVIGRLNQRTPMLRAAVARSINRKRVPTLTFVAVPAAAPEEGGRHE
jgi:hypothetical protein